MQDEPEGGDGFSHKMSLKGGEWACWGLTIHVQEGKALSLQQMREFLQASDEIHFKGKGRSAIYA
jgi:hypothetical protein